MMEPLEVVLDWPNSKPKVKDRPRFVRATGRVYTPKETLDVEKALAEQWQAASLPTFDTQVAVAYEFTNDQIFIRVEDADDYVNRKLRGDLDNYEKLLNDALNKVAWEDDRLIVKLASKKL